MDAQELALQRPDSRIEADLLRALERIMPYANIGAAVSDVNTSEQPEFVKARAAIEAAKRNNQ